MLMGNIDFLLLLLARYFLIGEKTQDIRKIWLQLKNHQFDVNGKRKESLSITEEGRQVHYIM